MEFRQLVWDLGKATMRVAFKSQTEARHRFIDYSWQSASHPSAPPNVWYLAAAKEAEFAQSNDGSAPALAILNG